MTTEKISKIDMLTIVIALAALGTSVVSIYFQFFNDSTELSAKFIGTKTDFEEKDKTLNATLSFLFLNTGKTEVAFVSGFTYYSSDETFPQFYFSGDRSGLDENRKKWYTQNIDSKFIIEPGKILTKEFELKIPYNSATEYFNQNFDLSANQKILLTLGVSINLIDSKGKLNTIHLNPSKVEFKYSNQQENLVFTGSSSNVNTKELKSIVGKYEIY